MEMKERGQQQFRDNILYELTDRKGNRYVLHDAYIRIFAFNVAILRFSVRSASRPTAPAPHITSLNCTRS